MQILRKVPPTVPCFSLVSSPFSGKAARGVTLYLSIAMACTLTRHLPATSGASDGGLTDLLGLIDFILYRDWERRVRRACVRDNLRVVTSLLQAVPPPVALKVCAC